MPPSNGDVARAPEDCALSNVAPLAPLSWLGISKNEDDGFSGDDAVDVGDEVNSDAVLDEKLVG